MTGLMRLGYSHVGRLVLADEVGNLLIDPTFIEGALLHRVSVNGGKHKLKAYCKSFLR